MVCTHVLFWVLCFLRVAHVLSQAAGLCSGDATLRRCCAGQPSRAFFELRVPGSLSLSTWLPTSAGGDGNRKSTLVFCLCRRPPVATWTSAVRFRSGGEVPQAGAFLRSGGRGKFRPAGQSRDQVVVQSPVRRPGPGSRRSEGGAVTPSLHQEVPDTQFVSPGRGLGIRQSMGWTKVCNTDRSGIWVLKGDSRTRTLLANLDRLRVEGMKR